MVRISSGWYFTTAQNDLRKFMDRCANGSGLACGLIGHEGFKPVRAWALHKPICA
jgi:hypothetical protein